MKSTFYLCFYYFVLVFIFIPCFASIENCNDIDPCKKQCDENDVCTCSSGCFMDMESHDCTLYSENPHLIYMLTAGMTSGMTGMDLVTNASFFYFKQRGKSVMRNMDYDAHTQTIFFIDVEKSALFSYEPKSNSKDVLLTFPSSKIPLYVSWDWISKNLFLVDFQSIQVCDEQLKHCSTVHTLGRKDIVLHFALAPKARYMFWTNMIRNKGDLHRAEMDGSNEISITLSHVDKWHSFVIDHESDSLYWLISEGNKIVRSDFDGNKKRDIPISKIFATVSEMAFINNYLYMVNNTQKALIRCDVQVGKCDDILKLKKSDDVRIQDMTVMHKSLQPYGVNHCENNDCTQLCVPNSLGYACKCSDDIVTRDGCQRRTVQLNKK